MPHISIRVSDTEKKWMENYAKMHGIPLSDAMKTAFFEKLEDEYDVRDINDYAKNKASEKFYTISEVMRELEIDNDL